MGNKLTVLWPVVEIPVIEEVEFCHQFSKKFSQNACQQTDLLSDLMIYPASKPVSSILPEIRTEKIIIVTDPEIMLSPISIERLSNVLDKGYNICGPVMNLTDYSDQQAQLPAFYLNVTTYLEVVSLLNQNFSAGFYSTDQLDPACVALNKEFFEYPQVSQLLNLPFKELLRSWKGNCIVDPGALVHVFGDYYQGQREDLINLIPEKVSSVLDVGTAMGGFGKRLKKHRPDIKLTGVELNPIMAEMAQEYYDKFFCTPVENLKLKNKFDLINCGDVLEHLRDPWQMLRCFNDYLKPNGYLVTSVPNVGHWTIVYDLLHGFFEYVPVGLLCISHLRWFTENSLRQAFQEAGFEIEHLERAQTEPTPLGKDFIATMKRNNYGDEQSLLTNEFLLRAKKKSHFKL